MDQDVVRRAKLLWAAVGLCVAASVLVGWGFRAAVVAALAYVGASVLAVTAFVLYLLLGDAPVWLRVLLIVLFLVGLVNEICGIASVLG